MYEIHRVPRLEKTFCGALLVRVLRDIQSFACVLCIALIPYVLFDE
jgi:hypothetical protein